MIPYFDAHCDTALHLLERDIPLRENDGHVDLKRLSAYGPAAQFFAIFGAPRPDSQLTYREIFDDTYERLICQLGENHDLVSLCRTGAEAEQAARENKIAGFITVEGADLLGCTLEGLERGYELGVRAVTITWNFENALSGTNVQGGGLTEEGKRFVKRMYDLGIIVDVSHLSDAGFYDICDIATGPIVATHSNSRQVFEHSRNLTDDMYKQIIRSGGVTGLNLYSDFVGENANLDSLMAHVDHFLDLGGERALCLGGDLDGCERLPQGIEGCQDLYKLYDALLQRGYGKELADNIFYNNLMGVVKKVCDI